MGVSWCGHVGCVNGQERLWVWGTGVNGWYDLCGQVDEGLGCASGWECGCRGSLCGQMEMCMYGVGIKVGG